MAPRPSEERAASVASVAAEMHGADGVPSCLQIVTKFGDSAMFDDGLSGGRMGCDVDDAGDVGGAVGFGAGRGAGGCVVGADAACGELPGLTAVGEGSEVAGTDDGEVVVGVATFRWRKASRGPVCPEPATARFGRTAAGASVLRITKVRATRVTAPTRADVPTRGIERSRTRHGVSELDTLWLSASLASR
jgi:hypothetical protein